MGTNYYLSPGKRWPHTSWLHIGKSSYGWQFAFRTYEDEGLNDSVSWKIFIASELLSGSVKLIDEYAKQVSPIDFWEMVDSKKGGQKHSDSYPDDVVRSEPTCEFLKGEFS